MNIKPRQLEIIDAAGKLLTTSGISSLTIKNLAAEMKFSESAIYRHFSSKEEIILTLLQYLHSNVSKILKDASVTDNYEKDFTLFFRNLALYFKENPYYVTIVFSEGLMDESLKINSSIIQLMDTLMAQVESLVVDGQKSNFITKSISSKQIAQIIIPTFRHQMFEWKLFNFQLDIVEKIDLLSESLLKILKVSSQ
ncbi:MAG: TetR/AcrR family transcriptional regulator [Tissierellia bacterium]|nr:TetR/AcrR family transcriptional regulator [Tissierellia bacterium]